MAGSLPVNGTSLVSFYIRFIMITPRRFVLACSIIASFFLQNNLRAQWLTKADESPSERAAVGEHHKEIAERDGIGEALKWYWGQRTFGLGYIPQNALKIAEQKTQAMRAASGKGMSAQTAQPAWSLVGPNNIGGRVNAIAINPMDASVVYAGAANGGVWKTTDAGSNWRPLTDQMQSVSMGTLAIDPNDTNTIFAGTGELSNGVNSYSGFGLLRSKDGGSTWSDVGPSNVGAYSRVIVNPKHSNLVYAAAGRSGGGVLRSSDGGSSWAWLAGGLPKNASVTDMALSMNGDQAVLYAGIASYGVYRSTDGGDNWTKLDPFPSLNAQTDMVRISLDVDPTNWENVVVLDVRSSGQDDFGGLEVSSDGGNSWNDAGSQFETQGSPFMEPGGSPAQGWYDVYIRVDPSDFTHMLFGGVVFASTRDGGSSWSVMGYNTIHPDHHAAAFVPTDPTKVYIGSDGGVFYSPNGGDQFNATTFPIPITQFYGIGIDQTQSDVTYGGTQDNGTIAGSGSLDWNQFGGGDGTYTLVDPKTPSRVYLANPQSYPQVSINQGSPQSLTSGINPSIDSVVWLDPFAADQNTGMILWGCQRLLYSTNQGAHWTNCTKVFGSAGGQTTISAIDAFGDGKTVLVGTAGGNVYVTSNVTATNGAAVFTDVSKGLPGRWVTWVKFSPSSKTTFYVTTSGFGAGHVFKTTDNGAHWTNISSTLPDIPVNTLVMDPQNPTALYIGTDVGVFFSPNDGGEWMPYGIGLPNTAVVFMQVHVNNRVIRAGTHGRSIWQVPLENDVTGIVEPAQRTVWTIGDSAGIQWHGFGSQVSLELSFDGGASWQNLASGVTGSSYSIPSVTYPPSENVLVRVSDGTNTLVSPLFSIAQQKLGDQVATVAELPLYLYDIAYDKDDNVLWATTYDQSAHIYKIDPDRGTLLDSVKILVNSRLSQAGLTGIKYDPTTKHLFLQQVLNTSDPYGWQSSIYEVTTEGTIVNTWQSPAEYGTGIYVTGDTILVADRMTSVIRMAKLEDMNFGNFNGFDFTTTRGAVYGPRGLTYDSKLGEYLLAYTDFEGTRQNATFDGSYVLFLDPNQGGIEVGSVPIMDGETNANIRGMEYDPRGAGNTAWITILTGSTSSKLVKIALKDGPTGAPAAAFTSTPSPISFGSLDTGKTETSHVEIRNSGTASGTITSLALNPASAPYSLGAVSLPAMLKAGDSLGVDVTFAPHSLGQQSASLIITFGTDNTETSVPIMGTATFTGEGVSPDAASAGWSLEVSPNPAKDYVDLTVNAERAGVAQIRIFDVTGREVRAIPLGMLSIGEQQTELSTSGLPNGIYFVRITGADGEVCSARLAIER